MSSEQTPNWHVTVCVHQPITPAQADGLFDTLADAAHGWEPAGVDVDVSGGPCYCRQSPSAPSFGAALGTILGASGGASQAGEDQAGVDRAVRDALRHIGYDGPDADPATERDFDAAAAAAVPVTVVGTRPPWQVHDSPPPTHGTPGAEPVTGAGWNNRTWATELIAAAREPVLGVEPVFVADDADYLEALLADRDRLRQRLADSIDPANIPDQRAKNWPDWHPEKYCHRCGQPNINWYADSAIWNEVHGGSGPIWCPVCFARAYEQTTARRVSWRLAPVEKSDQLGHLIRSEAAMRHERDAARAEVADVIARLRDALDAGPDVPDAGLVPLVGTYLEALQRAVTANEEQTAEVDRLRALVGAEGQEGWDGVSRAGAIRQAEEKHELSQQLFAALESVKQQLAAARRDAAADALLMVRQRFEESTTDGGGNIVTGWWLMWLQAWADQVRTGQRTISPQPATTTDDLPEWERELLDRPEET
jgi:hypothetical protein